MGNYGYNVFMLKTKINNQKRYISIYSKSCNSSGVHDNRIITILGNPLDSKKSKSIIRAGEIPGKWNFSRIRFF